MTAPEIIRHLQLQPHPEGGFYKEVYRSNGVIEKDCLPQTFDGSRNVATSIYYLLQKGDFSSFHRIRSDELWHHYAGGSLVLHMLSLADGYRAITLGKDLAKGETFQALMPAGVWFAAEPAPETDYVLAGCTVSPGFDFRDFELAKKDVLSQEFTLHEKLIMRLCR